MPAVECQILSIKYMHIVQCAVTIYYDDCQAKPYTINSFNMFAGINVNFAFLRQNHVRVD